MEEWVTSSVDKRIFNHISILAITLFKNLIRKYQFSMNTSINNN